MIENKKIRTADRDAIIQSLRAGVVPRKGLQHIQVGGPKKLMHFLRILIAYPMVVLLFVL
jgi:hypothetical protein